VKSEQRIGGYRILSPLGAGGMGEVWRAEDEKLGREVALKMLPAEFAGDTERMARFEREAKVLASLNHPNIATLFGLESIASETETETETGTGADSDAGSSPQTSTPSPPQPPSPSNLVTFLVMELVEGEDLSERIARGAIPVDEAVSIGRQIAEALEAAHEAGIVHRDLKPANIKLRPDGTVKVLDFGLAKAWETESADSSLSLSPTMTQHATAAGLILGTAAYMSPEQAAGTAADQRADIWAFGVVFWEMLTGHKLFAGETVSHVLASVLKDEVDLDELPESTPSKIRELIARCLQRKPRQRLQAIGDARIVLEDYERDPEAFAVTSTPAKERILDSRRPKTVVPWVITAVALSLFFLAAWFATRTDDDIRPVLRAEISAPQGTAYGLEAFHPGAGAISPDGATIAFSAVDEDGTRLLWVRRVQDATARPLPGTDRAGYPFWSPDSRHIGFFTSDGKLRRIDSTGGPPVTICAAANGKGGSWSEDGRILFAPAHNSTIFMVSASGGEPVQVTEMVSGITGHRFPIWISPGNYLFLSRSTAGTESDRVMIGNVDETGPGQELLAAASNVAVASGHLLFIREGTLMARPFDVETVSFLGDATPVSEDVMVISGARLGAFSASETGLLIYNTGAVDLRSELVWFDRDGEEAESLGIGNLFFDLAISADGRYASVAELESGAGTPDVWVFDLQRNLRTRFTFDSTNDWYPAWSPDGAQIAFASSRNGTNDIWVKGVGGSGEAVLLYEEPEFNLHPQSWSPDGKLLTYERVSPDNNSDIWAIGADGSQPTELVASSFSETYPAISPDGRWMAYVSDESGSNEVYVTTFPEPARRWQISTNGGTYPRWRDDGSELFFVRAGGDLHTAEIDGSGQTLVVGEISDLFSWNMSAGLRNTFDVSPDGQRVLLIRGLASSDTEPLRVVLNWDTELEEVNP